jgi:glycine/D-amino acid oxidase-like deaminating enzyme
VANTAGADSDRPPVIDADVLIVGGGIQGLWLLGALRREGCQALLVECRALGGGQTCHSHVYVHQGYLYREAQAALATRLHDVNRLWNDWFAAHLAVVRGHMPSHYGFSNPADAAQKVLLWDALGLRIEHVTTPPAALRSSAATTLFRTPETCLVGESLIDQLRAGNDAAMGLVRSVERIEVRGGMHGGRIEEVEVVGDPGHAMIIRPRAVALTAGVGNQVLLDLAAAGRRTLKPLMEDLQQIRKGHMLVAKGRRADLEPLTGVFPDLGGLFIVSREIAEEDAVVWLVSDNRSPPVGTADDWIAWDAERWLERVLVNLERLAPVFFRGAAAPARFSWGVYEAPKSEGRQSGSLPDDARVERCGLDNLWTIWPTKLTLVPRVTEIVVEQMASCFEGGRARAVPADWARLHVPPPTAIERWRKTPLVPWEDFRRCFGVPRSE